MNSQEPKTYSELEPNYLQHFRVMENGWFKWDVEVEQPRRYVDGGLCETHREARREAQAAIDRDLKRIAESIRM